MAGKNKQTKIQQSVSSVLPPLNRESRIFPTDNFVVQSLVLMLISFAFYFNTIYNEYALDDGIVIQKNEFVQDGFGGIKGIMTKDAYYSFYKQMGAKDQLSGGRYRPLSVVTFAIEQEFFGKDVGDEVTIEELPGKNVKTKILGLGDGMMTVEFKNSQGVMEKRTVSADHPEFNATPFVRHLGNILLYVLSIVVLLYMLRFCFFPNNPDLAFFTALIFAIHPIHTEVIANAKSRDEIMSFLFICMTFIFVFRHAQGKKMADLILGLAFFFLALLSKEYAIVLIALVPAALYVFEKKSTTDCLKATLPFAIILVVYFFMRFSFVNMVADAAADTDVLNDPYKFASDTKKRATQIFVLLKYIILLVFPHPLSSDYSYAQIAYRSFGNIEVWFSLALHVFLAVAMIRLTLKRHFLGFALMAYFSYLSLVCNLFFDVGATMGERLVYHSSLGYAIALAYFLLLGAEKYIPSKNIRKASLLSFFVIVTGLAGFKIIERNAEWKNDITLFLKDVNTVPNSVLVNGNAGARLIDLSEKPENKGKEKEFLTRAIKHLSKAVEIHPKYVNGYLNLGLAYFKIKDYDKCYKNWMEAYQYYPNHPYLKNFFPLLSNDLMTNAFSLAKAGNFREAARLMQMACNVDPNNAEMWYHLGGAYYSFGDYANAMKSWQQTLRVNPNHTQAKGGIDALVKMQVNGTPQQQQTPR